MVYMYPQSNRKIQRWLLCWINPGILPGISRQHSKWWLLHHPRDTTRIVFCCVQQDTQILQTHGGSHHLCCSHICRKWVKFCIIKSCATCVYADVFFGGNSVTMPEYDKNMFNPISLLKWITKSLGKKLFTNTKSSISWRIWSIPLHRDIITLKLFNTKQQINIYK